MKAAERHERLKRALHEQYVQARELKRRVSNRSVLSFAAIFVIVEFTIFAGEIGWVSLPANAVSSWHIVINISIAFLLASILVHIANFLLFKTFKDDVPVEMRLFYSKLWGFVFYLAAGIFALWQFGFKADNITLFAGFIATGFALSMREVILSYIVWMVLLFKHPFRIGDIIKVGDDEGLVEHIGTFYVKLSDGSGDPERCTRLPTKTFLEKPIQNYGTADFLEQYRIAVPDGVDVNKMLETMNKAVQDETDKNSTLKNMTSVSLETDALGAMRVVVVYPVVLEKRRAVRTRILSRVPHKKV